uniref:pre-B-cell leukemia homeobox interacting protein 1b isoform X1 n=1 Tax=Solea senegalensis TaxID=28829 RepID=UPI001CD89171|nr:pre-B-cell leukemia homeobox interacting protein 1b isoform X1 [Solea senegalensis]
MSGGNSASNNWTIVTPEETVAETLRPLAEGTEHHEEASAADSGANQPGGSKASALGSPVEEHMVLEDKAELIGHTSTEQHTSTPPALSDSCSFVPGSDASNHPGDLPGSLAQTSPDPDSFSDSYTHISPSPDDTPASLLCTETLGGEQSTHEEERLVQGEILHPLQGEELQQEGDQSDLSPSMTELERQADCPPVDSEVCEEKTTRTEEQGDPEVRRRRSLLAALERIGRTEEEEDREEEDREEEFQVPQRADDSGFTVNKCILGVVILLGLGTIFFSGVFMDLDAESDYGTRELKDSEVPGKQEWLNPEVPPPPADTDSTELLNKLAEGNQQISVLQAQLETQKEEIKVATEQAAEGAVERLLREEIEKENSRLKTEMASLPLLQKENERLKQELESVPALQKELETLRSTVTELKRSSAAAPLKPTTSPPSGQPEDSRQDTTAREARKPWKEQKEKKTDWKKEKYDTGEKKEWKEKERSHWKEEEKKERKDGGKMGKHEQGKSDKVKDYEGKQKRHSEGIKQLKKNEEKKEKLSRGDEGKTWKAREGKKERVENSEQKDWKEVKGKYDKKGKYEKVSEGKHENDWKKEKDYGERHKVREEWKGEKEWKKVNDGFKGSGKEKWEKKDWKEKGEEKHSEWRCKSGKDGGKEGKQKGENKRWEESENHSKSHGKERKGKDEKRQLDENERKSKNGKDVKEGKMKDERVKKEETWKKGQKKKEHSGDRKKDAFSSEKHKDEHTMSDNHPHDHHDESVWADEKDRHSHRRPSLEQPEYWVQQRERLQHSPNTPQHCDTLETCAQTEGLLPVHFSEFDTVLQNYLAKAEEAGVDASQREELQKLAAEFFKDGVFLHNQMSFEDFVEDVADILEDMVEGVENGEEVETTIEDEFEKEVMKKFSVPAAAKKEEKILGEQKKESRRGHG